MPSALHLPRTLYETTVTRDGAVDWHYNDSRVETRDNGTYSSVVLGAAAAAAEVGKPRAMQHNGQHDDQITWLRWRPLARWHAWRYDDGSDQQVRLFIRSSPAQRASWSRRSSAVHQRSAASSMGAASWTVFFDWSKRTREGAL
mgnify:CR=1 FL=1